MSCGPKLAPADSGAAKRGPALAGEGSDCRVHLAWQLQSIRAQLGKASSSAATQTDRGNHARPHEPRGAVVTALMCDRAIMQRSTPVCVCVCVNGRRARTAGASRRQEEAHDDDQQLPAFLRARVTPGYSRCASEERRK